MGITLIVIFPCAAHKPAHKIGFDFLQLKRLDAHALDFYFGNA